MNDKLKNTIAIIGGWITIIIIFCAFSMAALPYIIMLND